MKKLMMMMVMVLAVSTATTQVWGQESDSLAVEETMFMDDFDDKSHHADNDDNDFFSSFDPSYFGKEVLIPIVAIVFTLGMPIFIVLIVLSYRHKNKKAQYAVAEKALEAGKDIPEGLFNNPENRPTNLMEKGIKNTFMGLGLTIMLWFITEEVGIASIGIMILLIGIGEIVIHKVVRSKEKDTNDNNRAE